MQITINNRAVDVHSILIDIPTGIKYWEGDTYMYPTYLAYPSTIQYERAQIIIQVDTGEILNSSDNAGLHMEGVALKSTTARAPYAGTYILYDSEGGELARLEQSNVPTCIPSETGDSLYLETNNGYVTNWCATAEGIQKSFFGVVKREYAWLTTGELVYIVPDLWLGHSAQCSSDIFVVGVKESTKRRYIGRNLIKKYAKITIKERCNKCVHSEFIHGGVHLKCNNPCSERYGFPCGEGFGCTKFTNK